MIRSKFSERMFFFLAAVSLVQSLVSLTGEDRFGSWTQLVLATFVLGSLGFLNRHIRLRGEFLRETKGPSHNELWP